MVALYPRQAVSPTIVMTLYKLQGTMIHFTALELLYMHLSMAAGHSRYPWTSLTEKMKDKWKIPKWIYLVHPKEKVTQ